MNSSAILALFGLWTVSGCATTPHNNFKKRWVELDSEATFKKTVEEDSPEYSLWSYMGSDPSFHYFARHPQQAFIGKHKYYRIARVHYTRISKSDIRPIEWNSGVYSLAFSQAKPAGGFTHSFERGLVDRVLHPQAE